MGFFDRLFGKRDAAKPRAQRQRAATNESVSALVTLGNWRVLSGVDAAREAVAQRVMDASDNFAAALLTPVKPQPSSRGTLEGVITCHGCRGTCPFEEKDWFGGGLESSIVTCQCGCQITLMLSGASTRGAGFVVVSPFTSIRGQAVSQIGLRIDKITSEGEGQQQGARELRRFEGHAYSIKSVAFTPDGLRALVGDLNGQLWLWDVQSGQELRRWEAHAKGESVTSVAVSSDGQHALSSSKDMTARLWELETNREIRRFKSQDIGPIEVVAFAPDTQHVATGSGISRMDHRPTLILWDIESGREVRRFQGHSTGISGLAFAAAGDRLFSCSAGDKTVRVWDVAVGKEIFCHKVGAEVTSVACSPDGGRFLFGTYGANVIGLVDVDARSEVWRGKGHTESVSAVAFAPSGLQAVSGSWDHTARLWDLDSGREVQRFVGQAEWVTCVAFSPDGRFILVGGNDAVLRLYAVGSG